MLIYKYSQLKNENVIGYDEVAKICGKKKFHFGQLKLFFSELLFLSMHARPNDLVVYVGAAPGYHTTMLADMFPFINFDLWDPREFETGDRTNIRLFNEFFTDISAKSYMENKERILFMCDLRNMQVRHYKDDVNKIDEIVDDDMSMQMRWCRMIKPAHCYLKFRLPYEIPKTKYLKGTIYLQPYSPFSTEARLLTNDYNTETTYDNKLFDQKLAYHNAYNRCLSKKYEIWGKIMARNDLLNNWDNAFSLRITYLYLKNIKKKVSMKAIEKLFMEIIRFHIKKYNKKLHVIFKPNVTLDSIIGD